MLIDFLLSLRLPVNSRLLVVKFGGVKSYMQTSDCAGISVPNSRCVQMSPVLLLFSCKLQEIFFFFTLPLAQHSIENRVESLPAGPESLPLIFCVCN